MTRRPRSPLHVVCQPWPFPARAGERRHKPLCRWACRGPVRVAEFVDRRNPQRRAVLHPSTKQAGRWQVSVFDQQGAVGDVVRDSCAEALKARDISPGTWKLVEVVPG